MADPQEDGHYIDGQGESVPLFDKETPQVSLAAMVIDTPHAAEAATSNETPQVSESTTVVNSSTHEDSVVAEEHTEPAPAFPEYLEEDTDITIVDAEALLRQQAEAQLENQLSLAPALPSDGAQSTQDQSTAGAQTADLALMGRRDNAVDGEESEYDASTQTESDSSDDSDSDLDDSDDEYVPRLQTKNHGMFLRDLLQLHNGFVNS